MLFESLQEVSVLLRTLFVLQAVVFGVLLYVLRYRFLNFWVLAMLVVTPAFWLAAATERTTLKILIYNLLFVATYGLVLGGLEAMNGRARPRWWAVSGMLSLVVALVILAGGSYGARILVISLAVALLSAMVVREVDFYGRRVVETLSITHAFLAALFSIHVVVNLLRAFGQIPQLSDGQFTEALFFTWTFVITVGFPVGLLLLSGEYHTRMVSERLSAELVLKSRQAELAEVMANISHQWRDGLSRIGYINARRQLQLELSQPINADKWRTDEQQIADTLEFMSSTMQNFLDFYRPNRVETDFTVVESIEAVRSVMDQRVKSAAARVQINGDRAITMRGVRNDWMQVWMCLLGNALAAAKARDIGTPRLSISVAEGLVRVCDNCGGMNDAALDEARSNTADGMGLRLCHQICARYGWRLLFENSVDGLCVIVTRPAQA